MEIGQVLFLLGWLIIGVLFVALLAIVALGLRIHIVPDDQRYIIYKLGRFTRVAGPGVVIVMHRFESIEQILDTREQPLALRIDELQFNGVFLGYTVNFWYANDPMTAAGADHERLVRLVQFDDEERRSQIDAKVREVMMQSIRAVQSGMNTPDDATLIERLIPVLPGQPACEQLGEEIKQRLQSALSSIGVVLIPLHPVNISRIHLSSQLLENFGRGITLSMLREQMPDAPADILAQLLSSIEGREMPNIRKVVVERPTERTSSPASEAHRPARQAHREETPMQTEVSQQKNDLQTEDWRVLKTLPRSRAA